MLLMHVNQAEVVSVLERFQSRLELDPYIQEVLGRQSIAITMSHVMKDDILHQDPQYFVNEALQRCNRELQLCQRQS